MTKKLRSFDVVKKQWKYTTLGKTYYDTPKEELVVHMPVRIEGRRKDGSSYRIFGHLPVDIPGLEEGPDLKQKVLDHYGVDEDGGVVSIQSDEMWFFYPPGEWQISRMVTEAGKDPQVSLHRPLRGDGMCVPEGLSRILNISLDNICKILDEMGPWRECGVPSDWIFQIAERFGVTACCLFQDQVLKVQKPTKRSHRRALCWSIEGDHCVWHDTVKGVLKTKKPKKKKLKKDSQFKEREISEFVGIKPGYFFSTNVPGLRQEYRGNISVSEPHQITSLRIKTGKSVCVLKSYPEDWQNIKKW